MITDDKMRDIATKLLEKSQRNEVSWEPARGGSRHFYQVSLPSTNVTVGFISPNAEADRYVVSVSHDNEPIKGWQVTEEEANDWQLLSQLHDEASRAVLGWDKALEEIEQAVSREGVIGKY